MNKTKSRMKIIKLWFVQKIYFLEHFFYTDNEVAKYWEYTRYHFWMSTFTKQTDFKRFHLLFVFIEQIVLWPQVQGLNLINIHGDFLSEHSFSRPTNQCHFLKSASQTLLYMPRVPSNQQSHQSSHTPLQMMSTCLCLWKPTSFCTKRFLQTPYRPSTLLSEMVSAQYCSPLQ